MEEQHEKLIAGFLTGELEAAEAAALEAAVLAGELDAGQVAAAKAFYDRIGPVPVPVPSPALRANFYTMLAREKRQNQAANAWRSWLNQTWQRLQVLVPLSRLAYSLVLLALGIGLGTWINRHPDPEAEKLAVLTREMQHMKKMMMLTLLEQPSATDRLKAVNLTADMETPDTKVIRALLQTLNSDPSVNVRLAAIEALYQHADNPLAREGLVQAINRQESPLVQLALADVMVAMQEKKSVQPLKKLLKKEDLNEAVKAKVRQTIQVLI